MTFTQDLAERFRRSPIYQQLEKAEAADVEAKRRAQGDIIAQAERDRNAKRPPIAAALDKLVAERTVLLDKLNAKNVAIAEKRSELADVDNRAEHRIGTARRVLRETAPAAISDATHRLEELEAAIQSRSFDVDVEEIVTMAGRRRRVLASNVEAVKRRLAAIVTARQSLNALAETYAADLPAAIDAILATVGGFDPETPKEPVSGSDANTEPLAAA